MEKVLNQILSKLESIDSRLDNVEGEIKELKEGQQRLETKVDRIDQEMNHGFNAIHACFN